MQITKGDDYIGNGLVITVTFSDDLPACDLDSEFVFVRAKGILTSPVVN